MPAMGWVFQKTGLPSIAPGADPTVLMDTPFATAAEAKASAESYVAALNAAVGPDPYTAAVPQWTAPGVAPERWQVLIDDLAPPGVPVPEGARLEEIGDAWYPPPW